MNRHAVQLISRGAINKIGNMLYDYGNSVWLASMGTIGQTVLGMYQISELVTSILINPFGGVISDRFSRRRILLSLGSHKLLQDFLDSICKYHPDLL